MVFKQWYVLYVCALNAILYAVCWMFKKIHKIKTLLENDPASEWPLKALIDYNQSQWGTSIS